MSWAQVDRPTKVGHVSSRKDSEKSRKIFAASSHKKHKHEESRHFKFGRKRLQSFTSNGKFFPPYKRRKNEGAIIPPTKFLLGGNICDPLNLNSMQDEEINRAMNAVTPKSSPLPTPKHRKETIEVIIPPNICDPLNLSNCNDNDNEEYEKQLISPTKKGPKRRNRKRKRASSASSKDEVTDTIEMSGSKETEICGTTETIAPPSEIIPSEPVIVPPESTSPRESRPTTSEPTAKVETRLESPQKEKNKLRLKGLDDAKDKRLRKIDLMDKIVSPVIPQPGAWKPRLPHRPCQDKKKKQAQMPNFRERDARYQYGNYNRYYGYRNPNREVDMRLTVFAQRKELFIGKDVLDIGCNIGHITLSVARDFSARSVTGIDIDRKLVGIARKNVKHYVNCVSSPASNEDAGMAAAAGTSRENDCDTSFFPVSMPINYGPIDVPGFTKNKDHKGFPYNVTFVQGNYVLEDDALLMSEQPQFDTILCLSITKWIHLNFGDAGLKQAFKRMHAQLRPGGVLVLEVQGWPSYRKKKNLTERTYKTYQSIEFFPQKFTQYLLSSEVGFHKCEVVSIPAHPSKGFQRPIQLFTKAGTSPVNTTPNGPSCSSHRFVGREQRLKDRERMAFERDLFPRDVPKFDNLSDFSQRSVESMSQYEQLENVYAPSTTPCYDTPSHTLDGQTFEPEKTCYVDVNTRSEVKSEVGKVETASPSRQRATGTTTSSAKLHEARVRDSGDSSNRVNEKNNVTHEKRKIHGVNGDNDISMECVEEVEPSDSTRDQDSTRNNTEEDSTRNNKEQDSTRNNIDEDSTKNNTTITPNCEIVVRSSEANDLTKENQSIELNATNDIIVRANSRNQEMEKT